MRAASSSLAAPGVIVPVLVEAWLTEYQETLTEVKFKDHIGKLGPFAAFCGFIAASDLTPKLVNEFLVYTKRGGCRIST